MADISKIKMPGVSTAYNIKDVNALRSSAVGTGTSGIAEGWYECKLEDGKIKYHNNGEAVSAPLITTDIKTYADTLPEGIHFCRHATEVGNDKPVSDNRFYYIINISSEYTASIMAIQEQKWQDGAIYITTKLMGIWGEWIKCGENMDPIQERTERLDAPLLTTNVATYVDTLETAGIYFARHHSAPAYDKPVEDDRFYYIINVYATTTASIMAIQGQQRASAKIYLKTKTENTWGDWTQITDDISSILTTLNNKVDIEQGKGLSTNDFTTTYKNKVDRMDIPLLSQNITTYTDSLDTGIYFARHATTPAYDQPVASTRFYYIVNVYSSALASIIAIQGQQKASAKAYLKTKTENTWGDWIQITDDISSILTTLSNKVDAVSGMGLSSNDYTTAEKNKLAGIDTGANKTTVDSTLSSSSTNPVQNKVINTALAGKVDTVSGKGLSANDFTNTYKDKVDRLDSLLLSKNVTTYVDGDNNNAALTAGIYFARHPTDTAYDKPVSDERCFYIINVYATTTASIMAIQGQQRASSKIYVKTKTENTWGNWIQIAGNVETSVTNSDEYIPTSKAVYTALSNKINTSALKTSITTSDTEIPSCKAVNTALGNKVDTVSGKGLSTNDYTTTEKNKLAGIDTGANKTTVDSSLSSTSTNPVQNKVINTALAGKVDTVSGKGLSTNDFTTTYKDKVDRMDMPLLSKNVSTYTDGLDTGIYFARHATTPAYDQPTTSTRYNYIITVYSSALASIIAIQNQQRSTAKNYIKIKTESTWGDWIQITDDINSILTTLGNKVDKEQGKGLSTNDYTTTEKNKLAGIDTGANKTTVDSSLSSTSTNPVQNKVINTALAGKVDTVSGKGLSTNDFTTTYKDKVDRLDSSLLSKKVTVYADGISTAGVYFARHATTPAYDQPTTSTRFYYTIHIYSSTTAVIMAIPGQPRATGKIYTKIKTEGTWGNWYEFTGTQMSS